MDGIARYEIVGFADDMVETCGGGGREKRMEMTMESRRFEMGEKGCSRIWGRVGGGEEGDATEKQQHGG